MNFQKKSRGSVLVLVLQKRVKLIISLLRFSELLCVVRRRVSQSQVNRLKVLLLALSFPVYPPILMVPSVRLILSKLVKIMQNFLW